LKAELASAGIPVAGKLRTRSWLEEMNNGALVELGHTDSPPLSEILQKMMKPSQNLYAQLLLLQVGAQSKTPAGTTDAAGLAQLSSFAKRAGIPEDEILLDDGAGLSRASLVTPNAIVRLLEYMAGHSQAGIFRDSLPEPGGEGTLRNRLADLKGRLRAKTGTIRYVSALSGYLTTVAGEELAFSILLNAYSGSPSSSRAAMDGIVRLLATLDDTQSFDGQHSDGSPK
jgi:D-alanyl-D-alanine carboxypeptidase/D-alanyl-D-alanine-endopeptidase (penicillin-binding protein 4)